ncbi:MAG TPA: hypothetical protein VGE29_09730, partial [Prosthecobacter sp.]
MPNSLKKSHSSLLTSEGWDACVAATLLRSTDGWQSGAESRSHGNALRRLFEDIHIDAVLCIEGRPTVCIKNATLLDNPSIEAIRSKLWNLGATTLLIVERSAQIQVYSTFVPPARSGEISSAA